ncbi:hypothetical protein JCM33374_g6582 [Metschnikowia sp. JCM 33374]|nr:hypothetical protein JCM33374_g6582 [Metschnikowia sp. JCM 33374]
MGFSFHQEAIVHRTRNSATPAHFQSRIPFVGGFYETQKTSYPKISHKAKDYVSMLAISAESPRSDYHRDFGHSKSRGLLKNGIICVTACLNVVQVDIEKDQSDSS